MKAFSNYKKEDYYCKYDLITKLIFKNYFNIPKIFKILIKTNINNFNKENILSEKIIQIKTFLIFYLLIFQIPFIKTYIKKDIKNQKIKTILFLKNSLTKTNYIFDFLNELLIKEQNNFNLQKSIKKQNFLNKNIKLKKLKFNYLFSILGTENCIFKEIFNINKHILNFKECIFNVEIIILNINKILLTSKILKYMPYFWING